MNTTGLTGNESFQQSHHDSFMSMSPSSPTNPHPGNTSQSISTPFLPGYLLGDHLSHHSVSSPKLRSSGGSQSPSQKLSGTPLLRKESLRGKSGGPPIKSLYSSPTASDGNISFNLTSTPNIHNRSVSASAIRQVNSPAPPTTGLYHTPAGASRGDVSSLYHNQSLPVSPAQADPFYTQGDLKSDDVLDETWVTVFGFPRGATSFILQQFSQYGTILKHVVASECNWMHIHYLSKIQAKKALSKDGKIYGGCMRIGVTPCIEKSVMEEKENQISFTSPSQNDGHKSFADLNASSLTPIRPLTAAYVASKGEYEVIKDKPTPRRDVGLVSKLKEYMFGY